MTGKDCDAAYTDARPVAGDTGTAAAGATPAVPSDGCYGTATAGFNGLATVYPSREAKEAAEAEAKRLREIGVPPVVYGPDTFVMVEGARVVASYKKVDGVWYVHDGKNDWSRSKSLPEVRHQLSAPFRAPYPLSGAGNPDGEVAETGSGRCYGNAAALARVDFT